MDAPLWMPLLDALSLWWPQDLYDIYLLQNNPNISSIPRGLMDMEAGSHPGAPGSIPCRGEETSSKFPSFLFIIED